VKEVQFPDEQRTEGKVFSNNYWRDILITCFFVD